MSIDVPEDFLHALTDEEIILILWDPLAEMMVMIDPSLYRKYVTYGSKEMALL